MAVTRDSLGGQRFLGKWCATARQAAGKGWQDHGLVFPTEYGTPQDDANVRRDFRRVIAAAGLVATEWTPRELRHSFVSLLSDGGMPIERISRLVGHSGTAVTELVYRKQIRPVVEEGGGHHGPPVPHQRPGRGGVATQLVT